MIRFFLCVLMLPYVSYCQIISTVAGNGLAGYAGDGNVATAAQLNIPSAIIFDKYGNTYIADAFGNRIRKIDVTGIISTVAGNGVAGYSGDGGPATAASINNPSGLAIDSNDNLFISDFFNHRIRVVSPDGNINTCAGNGISGYDGDGSAATNAKISNPTGIAVDDLGNIYFGDGGCQGIRKVSSTGIVSTLAGTGLASYSGDNGPATASSLNHVKGLAFDDIGNLYLTDLDNRRLRKITPTGVITTIAGTGGSNPPGDNGPATSACLYPWGIAVDHSGNIFFSDYGYHTIRKITISGTIVTIAGITGLAGYNSDGIVANTALLNHPYGLALDSCGNLFVADGQNYRIRSVSINPHCWQVDINESWKHKTSIYPNPMDDALHIDGMQNEEEYKVYNIVGSVLQNGTLKKGGNVIDVRDLPVGMYMVEVMGDDGRRVVRKILKQ